jgi:hypothetical protein
MYCKHVVVLEGLSKLIKPVLDYVNGRTYLADRGFNRANGRYI